MKELIETRRKEFEENFGWMSKEHRDLFQLDPILSFHDQTVIAVLEKVREEVEKKRQKGMEEGQTMGEWRQRDDAILEIFSLLASQIEELKK